MNFAPPLFIGTPEACKEYLDAFLRRPEHIGVTFNLVANLTGGTTVYRDGKKVCRTSTGIVIRNGVQADPATIEMEARK